MWLALLVQNNIKPDMHRLKVKLNAIKTRQYFLLTHVGLAEQGKFSRRARNLISDQNR